MSCQPGDCRRPLNLPKGIYELTYSPITPEGLCICILFNHILKNKTCIFDTLWSLYVQSLHFMAKHTGAHISSISDCISKTNILKLVYFCSIFNRLHTTRVHFISSFIYFTILHVTVVYKTLEHLICYNIVKALKCITTLYF